MCGILGVNFNTDSSFEKALKTIEHRGKDNISTLKIDNNTFGHTRLAIIDLDDEANQPMEFDNIAITFNGEIYNFQELIKSENLDCITLSDTEVIIRLYQKYDTYFLHLLNGMFSFCIYDKQSSRFFCARDRFGKKPFYYFYKDSKFIFASEIKAILHLLDKKPKFNKNVLSEYLQFWATIGDETFYGNIYKLQAGQFLILENEELKIENYYDLAKEKSSYTYATHTQLLKEIENDLEKAIKYRLVGDEEIASMLSGGLDSSLISAIYSKLSHKKIHTFSIGYDEHTHYSELRYAKIVAQHIDSNHHEIKINKDIFIKYFEEILLQLDEPLADSAMIPTYILAKEISDSGLKVALSGEGSDEIFLGYDKYFDRAKENDKTTIMINQAFYDDELKSLLTYDYKRIKFQDLKKDNLSQMQQFTYNDFNTWIAEVLMSKIDRTSMANTLELRAPFLDFNLVANIFNIDDKTKIGDTNKSLLKDIALKYLPNSIVHRQKKGFSSPFIEWLYEAYDDKILNTILKVNTQTNFFNEDRLIDIFNMAKEGKVKQQLWSIYIFSRWFEREYL